MQNKLTNYIFLLFCGFTLLTSCTNTDDPTITPIQFAEVEYQGVYELIIGDTLKITPEILNLPEGASFEWSKNDESIATTQSLNYVPQIAENFTLKFKVTASNTIERSYQIKLIDPYALYFRSKTETSTEFITKIMEYKPAPGQFINAGFGTPEYAEKIIGNKTNTLSLGAWGGYVIFSFDHTIENRVDQKDFVVYGNAFKGLSEPGIVQVSFDENGNGLADDTWYELAGSNYFKERTILNYETTYVNPEEYANVLWTDNKGSADNVTVNTYHKQNYFPLFIAEKKEVKFKGTRVFPIVNPGSYVTIDALEWGYVDNYDAEYSTYGGNAMEIDWAVNIQSKSVKLKGIDFVKIYTGAQYNAGWLGELSTEVKGASDLSMVK
ncbi:hypothetical protein HNQ02_001594 [Flavobacterium sp. 7E]|uniref:PKD domain-containing protein n=1 Tax=Flavobacterium sp. 7E TaxID=2735898 RepID=UPI00156D4507|nr:PKD domain-containing protein [Flavobacterium sp. 7E]NRS88676.1 hypothetical protein [Flavobacterium sp. 7E]